LALRNKFEALKDRTVEECRGKFTTTENGSSDRTENKTAAHNHHGRGNLQLNNDRQTPTNKPAHVQILGNYETAEKGYNHFLDVTA
jgi:hypothetical protein